MRQYTVTVQVPAAQPIPELLFGFNVFATPLADGSTAADVLISAPSAAQAQQRVTHALPGTVIDLY